MIKKNKKNGNDVECKATCQNKERISPVYSVAFYMLVLLVNASPFVRV